MLLSCFLSKFLSLDGKRAEPLSPWNYDGSDRKRAAQDPLKRSHGIPNSLPQRRAPTACNPHRSCPPSPPHSPRRISPSRCLLSNLHPIPHLSTLLFFERPLWQTSCLPLAQYKIFGFLLSFFLQTANAQNRSPRRITTGRIGKGPRKTRSNAATGYRTAFSRSQPCMPGEQLCKLHTHTVSAFQSVEYTIESPGTAATHGLDYAFTRIVQLLPVIDTECAEMQVHAVPAFSRRPTTP